MYTVPATFARRELSLAESDFAILGVPFDSSESYRTGSRFAPNAIRIASRDLEDYDLEEEYDLLNLKISDLGDVEVSYGNFLETQKRTESTIKKILKNDTNPVLLGGEHTITYFAGNTLKKDTRFLIFDAHLDYRRDYLDNPFSHASITRRLSELIGPENILIIGARSGSKEELDDAKKDNLKFITSLDLTLKKDISIDLIKKFTQDRNVYVSIDFDAVDPSEARGVGNPEPGGIYYRDILDIFDVLKRSDLRGMDITEVTPEYDPYTPILAAKLIFKLLIKYKS